jgi:hypothetical protein
LVTTYTETGLCPTRIGAGADSTIGYGLRAFPQPLSHWPLNSQIIDGRFTDLLVLSDRAEALSQALPDATHVK